VAVLAVLVALDGDPAPPGRAAATPSVSVITRTPTAPPTSRRSPAAPPPRARPSATRSRVPGAGSNPRQDGRGRLTVCAESVSVRREPRPEGVTETVGTLRRGDTVTVLETNGNGWVRGRSAGSAVVTGWVLREFVKERCG
jgi:hypothetical protein